MKFTNAEFSASYGTSSQLKNSCLPEVVFSGRSNVGKSSLLNKLLGRKNLAHVSSTPGKTVTINFFKVDECFFVDLPGYGFAKRSQKELDRFAELMEGYFAQDRMIAAVVQLIDMRRKATEDDLMMLRFMTEKNLPFIIVLTKSDKLNKTEFTNMVNEITDQLSFLPENTPILPFSALKGDGTDAVKSAIEKSVENLLAEQE